MIAQYGSTLGRTTKEGSRRGILKKLCLLKVSTIIPVCDIIRPCVVMIMALKIESYLMALRENIFELIDSLLPKYQAFLVVPICSDCYYINDRPQLLLNMRLYFGW